MANEDEISHSVEMTNFGNGSIRFQNGNPGRPATTETTGNVTVNNAAIEPTPSFFDVSFTIGALQSSQGVGTSSTLMLNIPVPTETSERLYPEIEDTAARLLPPMLHALADLIEADIERAAEGKASRQKE